MSTTVIASPFGSSLYWWPSRHELDDGALAAVLRLHGLDLLPGSSDGAMEFIAAQDLEHGAANRLAQDLRGLGLTVRVVNKTGITTSRRLGNAAAAHFVALTVALLGLTMVSTMLVGLPLAGAAWMAMLAVFPGILFVALGLVATANGLRIGMNGMALPVAGVSQDAVGTTESEVIARLEALKEDLPETIVDPMLRTARELHRIALANPDGEAAAELQALTEDLARSEDEQVAARAKGLRDDVRRARLAMREARGRLER